VCLAAVKTTCPRASAVRTAILLVPRRPRAPGALVAKSVTLRPRALVLRDPNLRSFGVRKALVATSNSPGLNHHGASLRLLQFREQVPSYDVPGRSGMEGECYLARPVLESPSSQFPAPLSSCPHATDAVNLWHRTVRRAASRVRLRRFGGPLPAPCPPISTSVLLDILTSASTGLACWPKGAVRCRW